MQRVSSCLLPVVYLNVILNWNSLILLSVFVLVFMSYILAHYSKAKDLRNDYLLTFWWTNLSREFGAYSTYLQVFVLQEWEKRWKINTRVGQSWMRHYSSHNYTIELQFIWYFFGCVMCQSLALLKRIRESVSYM
jgi:hypothetical protein